MPNSSIKIKRGFILKAKREFDHQNVFYKAGSKWFVKKTGVNVELELIRNRSQIAKKLHEGETNITLLGDSIDYIFELSNPYQTTKPLISV
jgi:hypothetical protein